MSEYVKITTTPHMNNEQNNEPNARHYDNHELIENACSIFHCEKKVLFNGYNLVDRDIFLEFVKLRGSSSEISLADISYSIKISFVTVTRHIKYWESRGLLVRSRESSDKRRVMVRPTALFEEVFQDFLKQVSRIFHDPSS